jgi:hypothetical protein
MHKRINILLAVLLLLALTIAPVAAQRSWLEFDNDLRVFGRVLVDGASTFTGAVTANGGVTSTDFTSTDDLVVGDDLTVTDDVVVAGSVAITDDLTVTDDTVLTGDLAVGGTHSMDVDGPTTVTSGGSINCSTGGLHLLTAAGAVGTSTVVTTATEGVVCVLLNEAAQTITLTDTGVLLLTGNAALTQNDTLCLVSANSVWHEMCKNAN